MALLDKEHLCYLYDPNSLKWVGSAYRSGRRGVIYVFDCFLHPVWIPEDPIQEKMSQKLMFFLCFQAIKALFPSDWNPFYAGFGNRDTDEISYLKVGIPISKVFIINPKVYIQDIPVNTITLWNVDWGLMCSFAIALNAQGQVTVNRRVDTRSYTSLHELVNGIFPPMSSFEQVRPYNYLDFFGTHCNSEIQFLISVTISLFRWYSLSMSSIYLGCLY